MDVGIVSPGRMGLTIARSLQELGHSVFFASVNRSMETIERASCGGIENVFSLERMSKRCNAIICIGTGDAAFETASKVHRDGFRGLYIDFNSLNGEDEERKWRTITSNYTDNFAEGAIRGYPIEGNNLNDGLSRLMILSGPKADEAAAIFSGGIWDIQVSATAAKSVNRLMASGGNTVIGDHLYQDKTTQKDEHWEDEMLNIIANKFYVDGRTGAETMVYIWEQIRDGKLREICMELGFPEQLGFIHGINTFSKNLRINNSLDKPRGELPLWQEPR
jgi:hypothetical protein